MLAESDASENGARGATSVSSNSSGSKSSHYQHTGSKNVSMSPKYVPSMSHRTVKNFFFVFVNFL